MNKLLDLVTRWSQKFTYRILQIYGVSDAGLNKYLSAVEDRNEDRIEADKELSNKVPWIKYLFYLVLLLSGAYLYRTLISRKRRRY